MFRRAPANAVGGWLGLLTLLWLEPSLAAAPPGAETPEGEPEPEPLEVVVSPDERSAGPASVTVVDRDAIEASGSQSAADAIEQLASVHTATGRRNERIFSLRGFDQRQTVVLVDGAPWQIPHEGQIDLGMFPAEMIERVVVSRGPSSVRLGPSGLGGSVNIVTRPAGEGPAAQARLLLSQPTAARWSALHARRFGSVGVTLYGGGDCSEGFPVAAGPGSTDAARGLIRDNSDGRSYYGGIRLGVEPAPGHRLGMSASYLDAIKGVPPSTEDPVSRFWRFSAWRAGSTALDHSYRAGALRLDQSLYVRWFDNLLDSYDDDGYASQTTARAFESWYRDRIVGVSLRPRWGTSEAPWGPTVLRMWTHAEYDHHGEELQAPLVAPQSEGQSRMVLVAAPEVEIWPLDVLALTASCQLDAEIPIELAGAEADALWGLGPLLGATVRPSPAWRFGVTGARRQRLPTLKERFSEALGFRLPNPALGPERAWYLDLRAGWRPTGWLGLEASGFDAEVEDLIERISLGSGTDQLQNVGRARLAGVEAEAQVDPWRWLGVGLAYAWLYAERLDAADPDLEYRPAHKARGAVSVTPYEGLVVDTSVRVVGPQRFQHPSTLAWATLGAYALWDAQLRLSPTPGIRLLVQATNLLDTSYQSEFGFPSPGRRLWLGIETESLDRAAR